MWPFSLYGPPVNTMYYNPLIRPTSASCNLPQRSLQLCWNICSFIMYGPSFSQGYICDQNPNMTWI